MKEINKEIEKTFTEMDGLMGILYGRFKDTVDTLNKVLKEIETRSSSGSSSNEDSLAKISITIERLLSSEKDIETRLNHLFDSSQPAPSEEGKLHYSFYELKEMLTKITNGLPGLVNEKGEIVEKSLNLLTNFLAAVEKLEKGQEKWATIPVDKNSSYWLTSSSEKERLENELAKEKRKNDELRKKIISLEAAEKDRKNQLKQQEKKEQQIRNEIKNELASIDYSTAFPGRLSTEELGKFLTRLQEMKNSLNGNTNEQILKKTIGDDEHEKVEEVLNRVKLNLRRLETKQVIANALVDKWADLKGKSPLVIDKKELLKVEYRNYSETLDEINNLNEIIIFERKMLQAIAKQRNEYRTIDECLSLGNKAIESKNPKQIVEAYEYLSNFRELQLEKKGKFNDYDILLKKRDEFHSLNFELITFIKKQKEIEKNKAQAAKEEQERLIAQTVQSSK